MFRLATFIFAFLPFLVLSQENPCLLGRDRGDNSCGDQSGTRFYYDKGTKHCQPFYYQGCNGNENRFESLAECRQKCANVTSGSSSSSGHSMVISVPKCDGNVRAAVDENSKAISCSACPSGYSCNQNVCCPSKETVCNTNYDAGKFAFQGSHTPRYFYSKTANNCLLFTYYGALGNANNFETYNDCAKFCKV
uniref:BPTI/Kunitz inhibitor domain-containing protein n=1 Tax=Panagrolaimus sp. PS1159 TaxID=55785 RepID=A0AC35GAY0_9BILA